MNCLYIPDTGPLHGAWVEDKDIPCSQPHQREAPFFLGISRGLHHSAHLEAHPTGGCGIT